MCLIVWGSIRWGVGIFPKIIKMVVMKGKGVENVKWHFLGKIAYLWAKLPIFGLRAKVIKWGCNNLPNV